MSTKWIYALLVLMTLTAFGCQKQENSAYDNIDPNGWRYGDTLYFTPVKVDNADTTIIDKGNLSIVVRHNNRYEYSNLWLQVDYNNGDTIVTDTVNVPLADSYGNWLGQGMGISYQQSYEAVKGITIDLAKPVKVSHIMRNDTLYDIEQVGVIFMNPNSL